MEAEAVVTVLSILFGGYHLARAAWQRVGWPAPAEEWLDDPAPAAEPPDYAAALRDDPDAPLSSAEWRRLLNDEPNVIPHLAAFGPSGAGKSTFILALLGARPGRLVITTLKNATDDPWGGFPAVRLAFRAEDDGRVEPDWANIGAAIEAVYREVNLRHADGARPREPLTLVIDELTATIAALGAPRVVPRLIHMWLTARSVGVRLVVMDPTANVKGWGLDGRGDVRESIGFIRLDRDRSALFGDLDEVRAGDGVWLDTADVPALAAQGLDAGRVWAPVWGTGISRHSAVYTGDTTHMSDTGISDVDPYAEAERLARETNLSANRIYDRVGGNRNEVLRRVGQARGYRAMQEAQ